jgi:ligand-binding SRPBCC domain-containing protein
MRIVITQDLPVQHARVARIFADVRNLRRLTPPWPPLTISGDTWEVRTGAEFRLEFRVGPRTFSWLSVIETADPGRSFTDTFRGRFIRSWHHTHTFLPTGVGTRVTDEIVVDAAWWLRPALHAALRGLFMYRKAALARLCAGENT